MITKFEDLDLSKQYTYADYLTWHFAERVELFKGWVAKMSPAPNRIHQKISGGLAYQFYDFLLKNKCSVYTAPFDVRLINKQKSTPDKNVLTVVQPDICIICDEEKLDDKGCIGAPDLIVEILSKGNNKKELDTKFALYEENGVQEYWIVQPGDETLTVFDLVNDKYLCRKIYSNEDKVQVGILPELYIDLQEIFS